MSEHSAEHWRLVNEARYAQRLCERTARLYRRMHTFGTFMTALGGSAAITYAADWAPAWLAPAGVLLLAAFGATVLAVRPAERAAQNESDVRKYAELLHDAVTLSDAAIAAALAKARQTDVPEIEGLRAVAYNDLVTEVGRADLVGPLTMQQRILAALA